MIVFLSVIFVLGCFFVIAMIHMLSKPEKKVWKVPHKDFSVNRNYLLRAHEEDEFMKPTKRND